MWQNWSDPYQRMAADRTLQLEICTALESLADSLPNIEDLRLARTLIGVLEPSWTEHVSFQDEVLFPILLKRHDSFRALQANLDTFQREHITIAEGDAELCEQMQRLIGGETPDAGMLGYLLRNVFESRRRHIDSETSLLETFLPSLHTPADRRALESWTATRKKSPFPISLLLGSWS
jgi:hypothetical protein